jgi:hypothetical protein
VIEALRRDGIAYASWKMPAQELAEMGEFLDQCPVWPNHVASKSDAASKLLRDARSDGEWPAFAPAMADVVRAPHFFELALRAYPVAREYFDEEPLLYSVNLFWTQPATSQYGDTHSWHRDGDDRKQLGLFMYGTDVLKLADGAHLYQRGTHAFAEGDIDAAHARLDAELGGAYHAPDPDSVETVLGPCGTFFFEDPSGVHQGLRPAARLRMFAWARWGVSDPPRSYRDWDHLRPVSREVLGDRYPADEALQRAIRLVVS